MIAGLPVLRSQEVEDILLRLGFAGRSAKGGHRLYRHPDGRTTTVPFHGTRDISPTLLRKICRDISVTVTDFLSNR